jgi:integrase
MSQTATVQRLNISSVYNDITTYLNECDSEKTRKEYLRDIKEFFAFFHGDIPFESLTREHVECVKIKSVFSKLMNKDIIGYKNHLMTFNANSTVIRKITSVRTLYNFFQANDYNVVPTSLLFKLKKIEKKTKSWGIFSKDEVDMMANAAKNSQNNDSLSKFRFEVLSSLYYVATVTSIRISALLSLKWSDMYWSEKDNRYLITTIDKREQEVTRGVDTWLYDKLLDIHNKSGSNEMFSHMKIDWVEKQTQRLIKELGFPESRRLKVHSFRKSAIDHEMRKTGRVQKAMLQSGHKNAQTVIDSYMNKDVDYSSLAGITMFKEVDDSIFDLVGKNELLKLLKEMNVGAYTDLGLKIQELAGG